MSQSVVWRSSVLNFLEDPAKQQGSEDAWEFFEDGALLVEDGLITRCGPSDQVFKNLPAGTEIKDLTGRLLVPGFIDTHVHYPQRSTGSAVSSYWTGSTSSLSGRAGFADEQYAVKLHGSFWSVPQPWSKIWFGTVAPQSVDAFFQQAHQRNLRDRRQSDGVTLTICDTPPAATKTVKH